MHSWIQLPAELGPFDVRRGDRVLYGGRWRLIVDLTAFGSFSRGRVLRFEDGRLVTLRLGDRVPVSRRTDHL